MLFVSATTERRSERRWIALPVHLRTGASRVEGVTINISKHGVYLFAAANLSVGTELEIAFRSRDRKRLVRAFGIVRRKAVYLYGIEFLNDDTAARRSLLTYDFTVKDR